MSKFSLLAENLLNLTPMSLRGANTLFKDIFEEPAEESAPSKAPSFRKKKIDCIIDFYYYTGRKTGKSYPNILEILGDVFFLSAFTLHDIMQANYDKLALMKQEWKDQPVEKLQKHLVKKWPYIVW